MRGSQVDDRPWTCLESLTPGEGLGFYLGCVRGKPLEALEQGIL